jgi:hypothetical protein
MAVMRRMNRICGRRDSISVEELALDVKKLSSLFSAAFNYDQMLDAKDCALAAERLTSLETTMQALEFLSRWGNRSATNLKT